MPYHLSNVKIKRYDRQTKIRFSVVVACSEALSLVQFNIHRKRVSNIIICVSRDATNRTETEIYSSKSRPQLEVENAPSSLRFMPPVRPFSPSIWCTNTKSIHDNEVHLGSLSSGKLLLRNRTENGRKLVDEKFVCGSGDGLRSQYLELPKTVRKSQFATPNSRQRIIVVHRFFFRCML